MRNTLPLLVAAALLLLLLSSGTGGAYSTSIFTRLCSETDGGLDYFTAGNATDLDGTRSDECRDPAALREWYCMDGVVRSQLHVCPDNCSRGRCLKGNPNLVHHMFVCNDSDGGRDYYVSGVVNGEYADKCRTTTRLIEWYCYKNHAKSTVQICPHGCEGGACRNATTTAHALATQTVTTWAPTTTTLHSSTYCTESDGGRNFYTRGVTSTPFGNWTDECIGTHSGRIQEWYCSGDKPRYAYAVCPNGCANGACKQYRYL